MSANIFVSKSRNDLILMANDALRDMDCLKLHSPKADRATTPMDSRLDSTMKSPVAPAAAAIGAAVVATVNLGDSVGQPGVKRPAMNEIERSTRAKRRRVSITADNSEPESSGDEGDIPFRKPSPIQLPVQLWMRAQYRSKRGCAFSDTQLAHATPEPTAPSSSQRPAQAPWQSISPTAVEHEIVTRFVFKGNKEFYVLRQVGLDDRANFQVSVRDIGEFVSYWRLQEYEHRIFRENIERGWTDRDRYQAMKNQYLDCSQAKSSKRVTRSQLKIFRGEGDVSPGSDRPTANRSPKKTSVRSKSLQAPRRPQQCSRSKGRGNTQSREARVAHTDLNPKKTPNSIDSSVAVQLQKPAAPRTSAAEPTPAISKESGQRPQRVPVLTRGSGITLRFKKEIWNSYSRESGS